MLREQPILARPELLRRALAGVALLALAATPGCAPRERPSFLLFVMDTTRLDSVSAYGMQPGGEATTPNVDALAADGLRYTHAWANAPWTLPSHASLLTGLLPQQHGVGWRRTTAPDALETVAERLSAAGWETAAFVENAWLSTRFNLNQGFEHFTLLSQRSARLEDALGRWLQERDPERPFFLFVNVVDAHQPYRVRERNPFLPEGVSAEEAGEVSQIPRRYMCRAKRHARDLEILHGLYLGGVQAADAKLGTTLGMLALGGVRDGLVTVVTSDHGEHFGEHGFYGHIAGLRESLIHVPLVVHGLPGVAPAVVESPVQLAQVASSLLAWADLDAGSPDAVDPLPTRPGRVSDAPIVATWTDPTSRHARDLVEFVKVHRLASWNYRRFCRPEDRASGDMRALIRYPHKLLEYEEGPPELWDLRVPAALRRDLHSENPDLVAALSQELDRIEAARPVVPRATPDSDAPLPALVEEGLRALGYLDESEPPEPPGAGAAERARETR